MVSTQGPTEGKAGGVGAARGLWAKGEGEKKSLEGTGPHQLLRQQLEIIFFRKKRDESPFQSLPTASPPTVFVK